MSDAQGDGWAACGDTRGIPLRDGAQGGSMADRGIEPSEVPFLPRVSAMTAARPRQRRRLERQAALNIVEAPPGFGKTTLAVTWAQELAAAGTRVIWVKATDDPDDQSEIRDLVIRGLALSSEQSRAAVSGRREVAGSGRRPVGESSCAARPVMVVVDDAHLLRDSMIADSLVQVVRRARHVHLLVLADADHHFGLAAARHGQETNYLRAADLELLPEEIPAFAAAWGHDLDADDAQRLHRMVGGWPLPLRLVLDATPSGTKEFATSSAHDFVTSRVLPLITDAVDVSTASRFPPVSTPDSSWPSSRAPPTRPTPGTSPMPSSPPSSGTACSGEWLVMTAWRNGPTYLSCAGRFSTDWSAQSSTPRASSTAWSPAP